MPPAHAAILPRQPRLSSLPCILFARISTSVFLLKDAIAPEVQMVKVVYVPNELVGRLIGQRGMA